MRSHSQAAVAARFGAEPVDFFAALASNSEMRQWQQHVFHFRHSDKHYDERTSAVADPDHFRSGGLLFPAVHDLHPRIFRIEGNAPLDVRNGKRDVS